jgi:hypothetical protein
MAVKISTQFVPCSDPTGALTQLGKNYHEYVGKPGSFEGCSILIYFIISALQNQGFQKVVCSPRIFVFVLYMSRKSIIFALDFKVEF